MAASDRPRGAALTLAILLAGCGTQQIRSEKDGLPEFIGLPNIALGMGLEDVIRLRPANRLLGKFAPAGEFRTEELGPNHLFDTAVYEFRGGRLIALGVSREPDKVRGSRFKSILRACLSELGQPDFRHITRRPGSFDWLILGWHTATKDITLGIHSIPPPFDERRLVISILERGLVKKTPEARDPQGIVVEGAEKDALFKANGLDEESLRLLK